VQYVVHSDTVIHSAGAGAGQQPAAKLAAVMLVVGRANRPPAAFESRSKHLRLGLGAKAAGRQQGRTPPIELRPVDALNHTTGLGRTTDLTSNNRATKSRPG
jgi:hypothetical protein